MDGCYFTDNLLLYFYHVMINYFSYLMGNSVTAGSYWRVIIEIILSIKRLFGFLK